MNVSRTRDLDPYAAAIAREFHRVVDEVQQEPVQQIGIRDHDRIARNFARDLDAFRGGDAAHDANAIEDRFFEIDAPLRRRIAARVRAREEEKVLDDAREATRRPAHDLDALAILRRAAIFAAEDDVCFTLNDRDRRAQLVGRVGHEPALRLE